MKFFAGLGDRLRQGLRRSQELLVGELTAILEPERPLDDALFRGARGGADRGRSRSAAGRGFRQPSARGGHVRHGDEGRSATTAVPALSPGHPQPGLASPRPRPSSRGGADAWRQWLGQDHDQRQAGRSDEGRRKAGHSGGGGHLPRCRHRAAGELGRSGGGRSDPSDRRLRPGRRRVRRPQGGDVPGASMPW